MQTPNAWLTEALRSAISSSGSRPGQFSPVVEVAGVDAGPAADEALAGQALVRPRPPAAVTGAQLVAHHAISSCRDRGCQECTQPPKPGKHPGDSPGAQKCPHGPGEGRHRVQISLWSQTHCSQLRALLGTGQLVWSN